MGAVEVGIDESVAESKSESESDVDEFDGTAAFLPVSWETNTPIATDARMMNRRARPHFISASIICHSRLRLTRHINLFRLIACSFCFFSLHASLTLKLLLPSTSPAFQLTLIPTSGLLPSGP